jgi:hypothetical protein
MVLKSSKWLLSRIWPAPDTLKRMVGDFQGAVPEEQGGLAGCGQTWGGFNTRQIQVPSNTLLFF